MSRGLIRERERERERERKLEIFEQYICSEYIPSKYELLIYVKIFLLKRHIYLIIIMHLYADFIYHKACIYHIIL